MKHDDFSSQVDAWNRRYKIGQLVEVDRIGKEKFRTQTTGPAQLSAQGTPCVKVAELGWYILNRVKAVEL